MHDNILNQEPPREEVKDPQTKFHSVKIPRLLNLSHLVEASPLVSRGSALGGKRYVYVSLHVSHTL